MSDQRRQMVRRWTAAFTDVIVLVSFTAICCAMLMTVGDILVRMAAQGVGLLQGVRPRWGLFGLVDLTQLAVMVSAPLAISAAFFASSHIRVDLIVERLRAKPRRFLSRMAAVTGAGLMGICLWTAWAEMRGQLDFTTTSATLGIAYTWYWIPLIAGLALSVTGCVITFLNPQETDTHDSL